VAGRFSIPARGRFISQEPQTIAPVLLGKPLATFRRRAVAMSLDFLLFGIVVGGIFLTLTALSFHRENPAFFPRLKNQGKIVDAGEASREKVHLVGDFLKIVDRRCPDALPPKFREMVCNEDQVILNRELEGESLTLGFGSGPTRLMMAEGKNTLSIGTDLLLGSASTFLSWGALFVAWFTLWTRFGKGRTPAKRLLGIRVIRLDGEPLTWWDSFTRAGGYGASAATAFLGFLESIWHPNRQAMHDKVAGTVVVRD
jgi:uncharacterized RDD family membrane protein YckC